eukprot:scaffold14.g1236.t1
MALRLLQQQQWANSLAVAALRGELALLRSLATVPSSNLGQDNQESGSSHAGTIDFGFKEVPVEEKQQLVGKVFRSVAPSYDVMNDLMSGGLHRLWKDRLVEKLRPAPSQRHLDVAGGTGDVAFRVLDAIRDAARSSAGRPLSAAAAAADGGAAVAAGPGHVTVCDINAAMLAEGQKKAAARGIGAAEMDWVEGNAERLPFRDEQFDSYTIAFGIRNVTDRMAALREAHRRGCGSARARPGLPVHARACSLPHPLPPLSLTRPRAASRVLKVGGRFMCLEFSKVVVPGLQQLVVAGDAESYQYLVESIRMFPGQEEFARLVEGAGFAGVEYENLTAGVVAIHSGFKLR